MKRFRLDTLRGNGTAIGIAIGLTFGVPALASVLIAMRLTATLTRRDALASAAIAVVLGLLCALFLGISLTFARFVFLGGITAFLMLYAFKVMIIYSVFWAVILSAFMYLGVVGTGLKIHEHKSRSQSTPQSPVEHNGPAE